MIRKRKLGYILLSVFTILLAMLFLSPFYFLIVNSFKPFIEIATDPASLPKEITFVNFAEAFEVLNFPKATMNTLLITVPSVIGMNVISAMAAYRMARRKTKTLRILYFVLAAAMIVPFQSTMVSLTTVASNLNFIDSIPGLIILYLGLGVPFNVFLFHGFIKGVPLGVEEAAIIDGCSPFGVFFKMVYPLISTVAITVIILNTLWVWNDFLLPLLILPDPDLQTIPLAINKLFGTFAKQWDLAMPALLMSVAPIIILFLALQRYVVEGIVAGSVKG